MSLEREQQHRIDGAHRTALRTNQIPWGNYRFLGISVKAPFEVLCVEFESKFWDYSTQMFAHRTQY